MSLWTNGRELVSASEAEMLERGEVLAKNQPWRVLADEIGERAARALLQIILEVAPKYEPDTREGWVEVPGHTIVTIWTDGKPQQGKAGQMSKSMAGVVARNVGGRWVR